MDTNTLLAYDEKAKAFADDWRAQPAPDDMYELLTRHFAPGPTADIGCGSGRDAAWLNAHGFETVVGYDASEGLLQQARQAYPDLRFMQAALPDLQGIASQSFQNVLCETVIMHLGAELVGPATRRLLDILRPGGTLFLSWRVTEGASQRDSHQRLYSSFDKALVLDECQRQTRLLDQEDISASSGKTVHRIMVRKSPALTHPAARP
jgi:SAM-dependent methyltransferase